MEEYCRLDWDIEGQTGSTVLLNFGALSHFVHTALSQILAECEGEKRTCCLSLSFEAFSSDGEAQRVLSHVA